MNTKVNKIICDLADAISYITRVSDVPQDELQLSWLDDAIHKMERAIELSKELES